MVLCRINNGYCSVCDRVVNGAPGFTLRRIQHGALRGKNPSRIGALDGFVDKLCITPYYNLYEAEPRDIKYLPPNLIATEVHHDAV
jgi:hypothetical protein